MGSEDPMGPEPDGKLGSYSEIGIMGVQRKQGSLLLLSPWQAPCMGHKLPLMP